LKQNPHQVYTDSDTQQNFSTLLVNQPLAAISHFSAILTVNPNNLQAFKERCVAHCFSWSMERHHQRFRSHN
jgi:hypothetical protein